MTASSPSTEAPDLSIQALEPPLVIDAAYAERLHGLALAALQRSPDVAERLLHEVERARILPSGEMPADVVTIGSVVTFLDRKTGRERTVSVVFPSNADYAENRVSILTPIGAALIGLEVGASIDWTTRSGMIRRLTVLGVEMPHAPPG